jgi:hypothetical protein
MQTASCFGRRFTTVSPSAHSPGPSCSGNRLKVWNPMPLRRQMRRCLWMPGLAVHRHVVDGHGTAIGALKKVDSAQQRGFSRAGWGR